MSEGSEKKKNRALHNGEMSQPLNIYYIFFQLARLRVSVGACASNDGSLKPVTFSKRSEIIFYPLSNYP